MNRTRSAGSIFWGFILIGVGVIFLLRNLGYDLPLWTGVAKYWPVLLIVWGLIKLIDYARWKRAGQTGPLFGAGELVLLIVVILSGSALTAAANMSPDLSHLFEIADFDLWEITGNSYEFPEPTMRKDVPSASSIEIINRYGSVDVLPTDVNEIVVDVAKTVVASNEAEARELSSVLKFSIIEEGNLYRVRSNFNRDENRVRGRRFRTSLTVRVPRRASVSINNRNGNVEIAGLTGDQTVGNAFGTVTVRDITGGVNVDNRNDLVTVEDINGAATIRNEFASVSVKNVSGALQVRHRNGSVDVSGIKGDTKISNAFGSVNASDVQGALNIDARNTSIEASRIGNDLHVKNQFESVRLEDIKGRVDVDNRNGSVSLRYLQPPSKDIRIDSQFGDVTLVLPPSSAFSMDARTRWADLSTDFPELSHQSDRERRSASGQVGAGGPQIRIENRNGSIRIEK